MAITSSDVARRAGVSRATVSYVLNDAPNQTISAATRHAVLEAAQDLGYRPNAAARALRTGHSPVVLMPLIGGQLSYAMDEVLGLLAAGLATVGLTLVTDLTPLPPDEKLAAWERLNPAVILDLGVADQTVLSRIAASGVPVLAPESPDGLSALDAVGERLRARQLRHVAEQGCRRVVMLWPEMAASSSQADELMSDRIGRLATDLGLECAVVRADLTHAALARTVDRLLEVSPGPDAVCAYNDFYAVAVMSALAARGVGVPDEVALIGSDDTVLAGACTPTLTSVIIDYEQFVVRAVAALRSVIAGEPVALDLGALPVRLVRRQSA